MSAIRDSKPPTRSEQPAAFPRSSKIVTLLQLSTNTPKLKIQTVSHDIHICALQVAAVGGQALVDEKCREKVVGKLSGQPIANIPKIDKPFGAWEKQVPSARGFKRVGRHSEHPI